MAKRKRLPHEKPFSRPMPKAEVDATVDAPSADPEAAVATEVADAPKSEDSQQFIGKWNRLISTTNWEKGKIICEWREALIEADAEVTQYSDEAWAQLVGGVTSQHVGRLRRVSQRFGDASEQYEGLHWSHFQACLDWDDAEMWLEGSIQNGWSVSQMRGKRWETVGTTPEDQQAEVAQVAAEQDTEAQAEDNQAGKSDSLAPTNSSVNSLAEITDSGNGPTANEGELPKKNPNSERSPLDSAATTDPAEKRTRLSVDVESLPDDLAEAFESFKLAIIAHRRENWRDTTPASVVECLESLKQLATADAE